MTYTEKRLEDSTLTPKILDILAYQQVITNQGENYTGEKDWALNKLKSLISESIAQAVAKERARVVEEIDEVLDIAKGNLYPFQDEKERLEIVIEKLTSLSSFKPLTDNE